MVSPFYPTQHELIRPFPPVDRRGRNWIKWLFRKETPFSFSAIQHTLLAFPLYVDCRPPWIVHQRCSPPQNNPKPPLHLASNQREWPHSPFHPKRSVTLFPLQVPPRGFPPIPLPAPFPKTPTTLSLAKVPLPYPDDSTSPERNFFSFCVARGTQDRCPLTCYQPKERLACKKVLGPPPSGFT